MARRWRHPSPQLASVRYVNDMSNVHGHHQVIKIKSDTCANRLHYSMSSLSRHSLYIERERARFITLSCPSTNKETGGFRVTCCLTSCRGFAYLPAAANAAAASSSLKEMLPVNFVRTSSSSTCNLLTMVIAVLLIQLLSPGFSPGVCGTDWMRDAISSDEAMEQHDSQEDHERDVSVGDLHADVYNWADMIQNYIEQLALDGIRKDFTQKLFDEANYTMEVKNASEVVKVLRERLEEYFSMKMEAARKIAAHAVEAYEKYMLNPTNATHLKQLPHDVYKDSDDPISLPEMNFSSFFKQNVSHNHSTVKIADEVPRELNETIFSVDWTHQLESVMKENAKTDKFIRWQYFGTTAGVTRLFPGREWSSNFVGFYKDYDSRMRPWYIAATSGPKDVVIVLDCSLSMAGEKFGIAKTLAKAILRTLTNHDYVNVICSRASHWDEVGKWHYHKSEALSCQEQRMVPATNAHRKDLMEKIDNIKVGGTTELEEGFQKAFNLLYGKTRTGCQSLLIFVTDGRDTDGESVRCGPGYYTRSGYVPGPVCKYEWAKVWQVVDSMNSKLSNFVRIFSYLIIDDGEEFPGKLACNHHGSMKKLTTGENLISQLSNYFDFLARHSHNGKGLWTSAYLDAFGLGLMITYAVPAISKKNRKTIGVAGVDATLEEIEMFLTRYQWGSVTSFLIDKEGQTIFHPLLKASHSLIEDPIFIPIERLEQDKEGNPREFTKILEAMLNGKTGSIFVPRGRRGTPKGDYQEGVKYDIMGLEYHYAHLNSSEYSFAFVLADTDKIYRNLQEPPATNHINESYFNLLIEYNSSKVGEVYPKAFHEMEVYTNETKYPRLRVSYKYSSIFFSPQCHCDPNKYFFDDDLAQKTLDAHRYMNERTTMPDVGCGLSNGKYEKGTRAYVLVTQPIEQKWLERRFDLINQVMWTYVGMRSGVFRTFPGHRSTRLYDPTKRPWYRRTMANPHKISISTPYMDAAGSGKIITISQAVFEGMQNQSMEYCTVDGHNLKKSGGCSCKSGEECKSGYCYVSSGPGPNSHEPRCATERIEAITSLDIRYDSFHEQLFKIMKTSDSRRSCEATYPCPDGTQGCRTKCYLFDDRANVIVAKDFVEATALDTGKYKGVTLGKAEGEIMRDLVYKHRFFRRTETLEFQGVCSFVGSSPKVTLTGIPTTPEAEDNYYRTRGPIPSFSNSYGCIQDVVGFTANYSALGKSRMLEGNVSGACMSGFYYVTAMSTTNLYLLVVQNWRGRSESSFYNFNCILTKCIVGSGAYRIINGTCAHEEHEEESLAEQNKCPAIHNTTLNCTYNSGSRVHSLLWMAFSKPPSPPPHPPWSFVICGEMWQCLLWSIVYLLGVRMGFP